MTACTCAARAPSPPTGHRALHNAPTAARARLHIALVTETWPPEINGVSLTLSKLVQGLCARNHQVQLIRPRQTRVESVNLQGPSLPGDLSVPPQAKGLVMFAHGSGSSRHSARNRWVADALQQRGLATLLFDLLTVHEAEDRRRVFDIPLLGRRVVEALRWVEQRPDLSGLRLGLFGASTGAAAALKAAISASGSSSVVTPAASSSLRPTSARWACRSDPVRSRSARSK